MQCISVMQVENNHPGFLISGQIVKLQPGLSIVNISHTLQTNLPFTIDCD